MARPKPSLNAFPQAPETESPIRDFPDGFSQLLTMVAQWASNLEPGPELADGLWSALCRADLAMSNPARWSCHALRTHSDPLSVHLSCLTI